ncbi:MAG TPA: anthranilate phosphoribosyltransferase [Polyangiaceae bacterium]|nr:anthranilate phosphoribosyltransferase [Polyangiaceae bacterium]
MTPSPSPKFPDVFAELLAGRAASPATVRRVFDAILAGEWTPVQIAGFLTALRFLGETAETVAAGAAALRAAMVPVEHGLPRVVDTCGTGGDGLGTLNISTGAAILVASLGIPVAKHGNRAASSKSGSADVLEALGVAIDLPAPLSAELLREVGIAFLLAPVHHPAMRHAGVARKELGVRTIFNLLGPLANPAGAKFQLVGAPDETLRPILAKTLAALGTERAWVVRGDNGLDEMNPAGPTRVAIVSSGEVKETTMTPADFGLEAIPLDAIRGGDPAENAAVLERVLGGEAHPSVNAFLLNAAAAVAIAEDVPPKAATERVRAAISSGAARRTLERFREASQAKKKAAAGAAR